MEIKAGDKVRIKSWEKVIEENPNFYDAEYGEIERGPTFQDTMGEYHGKEWVVNKTWKQEEEEDGETYTWFTIDDETGFDYTWSSWMVKEVVN